MIRTIAFLAVIWGMGLATCHAGENWPSIGEGINLDFATTQVNKVGYDPGFYEAFQAAGFDSVRFFVKTGVTEPVQCKTAIDDALERGLTVVLAGFTSKHHGKERFVDFWRDFAEFYQMYPKELVFVGPARKTLALAARWRAALPSTSLSFEGADISALSPSLSPSLCATPVKSRLFLKASLPYRNIEVRP